MSRPDCLYTPTIRELAPLFSSNQLLCLPQSYTKVGIIVILDCSLFISYVMPISNSFQ